MEFISEDIQGDHHSINSKQLLSDLKLLFIPHYHLLIMADLSTVGMIGLLVLLHIAGKALMAQLTPLDTMAYGYTRPLEP